MLTVLVTDALQEQLENESEQTSLVLPSHDVPSRLPRILDEQSWFSRLGRTTGRPRYEPITGVAADEQR